METISPEETSKEAFKYPKDLNTKEITYLQFGPLGIAVIIAPIAILNIAYSGAVSQRLDLGEGILLMTIVSFLSVFLFAAGVVGIIFAVRAMRKDFRVFDAFVTELIGHIKATYGISLSHEETVRLIRGYSVSLEKPKNPVKLNSRSEENVRLLDFNTREELPVI